MALCLIFTLCACSEDLNEAQQSTLTAWADDLYEPDTSISFPATIVWPADKTAEQVADSSLRPNTMIVKVDQKLKVYTLSGELIAEDLGAYLANVKDTTLAALYIADADTAAAVNEFAAKYRLADVFVVADYRHPEYVTEIVEANAGVLGIIDWTKAELSTEQSDLLKIVRGTNAAHAKIAIIPESIAAYDAVEYLRAMLITVWAETSPTAKAIYTQLANGVNGICCADYEAVAEAISSFEDNGVSLLRHVFITGHRGMPGAGYIENTISSAVAAVEAGADVLECDVGLSADGEIFVLHDDTVGRLFNDPQNRWAESLTLAELQALRFDMTDDTAQNAPNSVLNANNTNRTTAGREDIEIIYDPDTDRITSLREYIQGCDREDVFHFIEIKSYRPEIIAPLKALCEELGIADRMCIITFNDGISQSSGSFTYDESTDVLKAMEEQWPEMSLGYLGMGINRGGTDLYWGSLGAKAEAEGTGAAVGHLYTGFLKKYNATLNDYYPAISREVNAAARHRGLTSWDWTYNNEYYFADHYLNGGTYSMTTNFAFWASDWAVTIRANDAVLSNGDIPDVKVISQRGDVLEVNSDLQLKVIDGVDVTLKDGRIVADEAGEALVMVYYETQASIEGVELYGSQYVVYSAPITLTIQ